MEADALLILSRQFNSNAKGDGNVLLVLDHVDGVQALDAVECE
jgi:hypothetical protein